MNDDIELPVLPYGGTNPSSGYSGSNTSAQRARQNDSSGKTAETQVKILSALTSAGTYGMTVAEAREVVGRHHGVVSGCLSNLHKVDAIARLAATRDGCKIYVMPNRVAGRKTERQGR